MNVSCVLKFGMLLVFMMHYETHDTPSGSETLRDCFKSDHVITMGSAYIFM
jgi:hypothetical protein